MRITPRRLLPVMAALVVLFATAPGASALTSRFHTQSVGNRGADVRAIQGLLTFRGHPVAIDGVFGVTTRDAVAAFQASLGLTADGIVGEVTWPKLLITIGPGSSGEQVKVLQRLLNEKRRAKLPVDGVYGTATRNAVIAFQRHMSQSGTGVVGGPTWRWLLWHYDYPSFNATTLCDYSVGNGLANWGTGAAVGQIEAAAAAFKASGHGRVVIGDISREHGGDIALHQTHEVGLDVDVRPIRTHENQCTWGTNWRVSSYDRAATRALIKAIRATAPGHVKLIYFNDPVLIREGLTRWFSGHDDHLHVRYCEKAHALAAYRC
jgi:peptidoglycan hydrolase-like protein with peptidoglycan-binding domain